MITIQGATMVPNPELQPIAADSGLTGFIGHVTADMGTLGRRPVGTQR